MTQARNFAATLIAALSLTAVTGCDREFPSKHQYAAPEQQAKVMVGMSREQVTQLLGEPWQVQKFRNQPGPTLVLQVRESPKKVFDVDLDAQGMVMAASVRDMPVPEN